MSFKLIAIRPLQSCDRKFLKVLHENTFYTFYNEYAFETLGQQIGGEITGIIYTPSIPKNLFNVNSGARELSLNISAIVGKNGSGKSSLMELLYLMIYNVSVKTQILEFDEDGNVVVPEIGLAAEAVYLVNEDIYVLKTIFVNGIEEISISRFSRTTNDSRFDSAEVIITVNEILRAIFFYTISISYSVYGLNSSRSGNWIKSLFRKNDGYQTPIVINPFRNEGNIDINIEDYLVKQRLLSNILEPVEITDLTQTLRNLASEKNAVVLTLKLNEGKIEKYTKDYNLNSIQNIDECISKLYSQYTKGAVLRLVPFEPELQLAKMYLASKIIRVCTYYDRYKSFLTQETLLNVDTLVEKILQDSSHITFKIRQAINFILHRHIPKVDPYKPFDVEIESLSKIIESIKLDELSNKERALSTIELLPPSFFDIQIVFDANRGTLDDCSSGEKQKIHSLNSIVYHILNVNSVFDNGDAIDISNKEIMRYHFINVFFDEVELYFHPAYQRTFVNDILSIFGRVNSTMLKNIEGVNICFSTHSPFILSDIPKRNVLFLGQDGYPEKDRLLMTFGANIHDLLKDSFFMDGGPMGQFVTDKINETIRYLNSRRLQDSLNEKGLTNNSDKEFLEIINLIDEPILKRKLLQMFDEVTNENEELKMIQKRISELKEIEAKLKSSQ